MNKDKVMVHEKFVHNGVDCLVVVSQERVDNRKDKRYEQRLHARVSTTRDGYYPIYLAAEAMIGMVDINERGGKLTANGGTLAVCRKADKPSAIEEFTQAECLWYAGELSARARKVLDDRASAKKAEARVEEARRLARLIAERAGELAKERTNFDARLAGLRAEYMATQEALLGTACEWARIEEAKLAERIEPKVLEAAIKHASECLYHTDDPFRSVKTADIKPEEVL